MPLRASSAASDCPPPAPGTRRSAVAAPKPSALVLSVAKMKRPGGPGLVHRWQGRRSGSRFLAFPRFRRLRAVDQLDQRHRRLVADAEAELEDAQVAARTRLVARAELVEELHDDVAIAQPVEREAAIRDRRRLAERDQRLRDTAQLLRLRQRGP